MTTKEVKPQRKLTGKEKIELVATCIFEFFDFVFDILIVIDSRNPLEFRKPYLAFTLLGLFFFSLEMAYIGKKNKRGKLMSIFCPIFVCILEDFPQLILNSHFFGFFSNYFIANVINFSNVFFVVLSCSTFYVKNYVFFEEETQKGNKPMEGSIFVMVICLAMIVELTCFIVYLS